MFNSLSAVQSHLEKQVKNLVYCAVSGQSVLKSCDDSGDTFRTVVCFVSFLFKVCHVFTFWKIVCLALGSTVMWTHKLGLAVSMHWNYWVNILNVYLLYLFWPLGGITKGHEYTVGQNSTHNDHAEKSEEPVKENIGNRDNHKHQKSHQTHWKSKCNNQNVQYLGPTVCIYCEYCGPVSPSYVKS